MFLPIQARGGGIYCAFSHNYQAIFCWRILGIEFRDHGKASRDDSIRTPLLVTYAVCAAAHRFY